MTTEFMPVQKRSHEQLVSEIAQALIEASWRMKYDNDPERRVAPQRKVYPRTGKGRFLGTTMYMWRVHGAKRPLWIGYDGNLYYRRMYGSFVPAEYQRRNVVGLERLLRHINNQ